MKVDYIFLVIALSLAALLAWGTYEICIDALNIYSAAVTFLTLGITGAGVIAVRVDGRRLASIRAASCAAFVILLILNYVFSFYDYSIPLYIILNAIVLMLYIMVCRMVFKSDV